MYLQQHSTDEVVDGAIENKAKYTPNKINIS